MTARNCTKSEGLELEEDKDVDEISTSAGKVDGFDEEEEGSEKEDESEDDCKGWITPENIVKVERHVNIRGRTGPSCNFKLLTRVRPSCSNKTLKMVDVSLIENGINCRSTLILEIHLQSGEKKSPIRP